MNNETIVKFAPFRIFNVKNACYIFRIYDNKLFQIDDRTRIFLKQEGKTFKQAFENVRQFFTKEEFFLLIENMVSANFLISTDEEIVYVDTLKDEQGLSSLTLMVIQECNMKCSYCYGEGGEYFNKGRMTIETAIKSIDYLIKESQSDELLIAFFGGEPLMNFPLIKKVVMYCNEQEKCTDKVFRYTITTNGTLINKRIEDFLIDNNIMIQISLDGSKKKHDKNRYFSNKKGSYDLILERTHNLRKRTRVSGRATLTADNLNYTEVFKHLNKLNFSAVPIAVAENMIQNDDYEIKTKEFIKLVNYCKELIGKEKYDEVIKLPMVYGVLRKLEFPEFRQNGCNVGSGGFAVDIDGSLYPCHRFVSKQDFKVGDVEKGPVEIQDFIEKQHQLKHTECNKCWARNICLGGCPFENYEQTGFMEKASDKYCEFTRKTTEEIVNLYLSLNETEKDNLFQR